MAWMLFVLSIHHPLGPHMHRLHRRQRLADTAAPGQAMSEPMRWSLQWHLDSVEGKLP
jgi:hypothetical protein